MSKLVIELQKACVNPTLSYADLFQKAYFIARKLEQKEMIDFLRKEIDGYKKERKVPDFRYIDVIFKAMNPMRGWIPVAIPSNSPLNRYLHYPIFQSICEMESFLHSSEEIMVMSIPAELQELFISQSISKIPFEISAHFSKSQFKSILETGKRMISDWALDLEQKGVLGEDFEFSSKEKEIAKNMTIINNYGNINGSNVVGSAINSTLNANGVKEFDYEGAKKLLESIKELIKAPSVDENDRNLLNTQIGKIDQKINQKDSKSIGTLLNSLGVWAQSITCSVIGSDIYNKIDTFLKTIQ